MYTPLPLIAVVIGGGGILKFGGFQSNIIVLLLRPRRSFFVLYFSARVCESVFVLCFFFFWKGEFFLLFSFG